MSKAEELIACLEGEIAKRDEELAACRAAVENCEVFLARIVELEDDLKCAHSMLAEVSKAGMALRAELSAIKAQEPVAEVKHGPLDSSGWPEFVRVKTIGDFDLENLPSGMKLYAAPVSEAKAQGVVMPERQVVEGAYGYDLGGNYGEGYSEGWNDCIDEFARLNGAAMTNTIPNVPRELLERVKSLCEYWFVRGQQQHMSESEHKTWHALGFGSSAFTELRALLSAPSPAGVDGLEVVAWQQRYIDPDEGVSARGHADARSASILKGRSDYELRPLYAVPPDAQAIIDGLRGDVERLQFSLEVAKTDELSAAVYAETESIKHSLWDAEKERDQQARRICELEGLLLRVQVSLSLDDTEWGYSGAEKYKLLADIRAAMSAGKDSEQ